jgi:UDP-2,3-diacylglucosamine pyrophosphatase LpxH
MTQLKRQIYVISDLHIGGAYGDPSDAEDRGFRINTHVDQLAAFVRSLAVKPSGDPAIELVIAGDFVDFLAEREESAPHWQPFVADPAKALAKLNAMVERDRVLFDAFGEYLAAGHRLVVLLGNHDIELSFPTVRERLAEALGAGPGTDYLFTYDGEAYRVGDALIEHGNRYDGFNVINMNDLRQVRSMQSRGQIVPDKWEFEAPPGSFMVAEVINPIKESYRFIDLLKPETGAVVPILLALEPSYRSIVAKAAKNAIRASKFKTDSPAQPSMGGDISSGSSIDDLDALGGDISSPSSAVASTADPELEEVLRDALGADPAEFMRQLEPDTGEPDPLDALGGDISAMDTLKQGLGLAKLLLSPGDGRLEARLPALLAALRALQEDNTFDPSIETRLEYLDAAKELAAGDVRHVVFGHTHIARKVDLGDGRSYLNSGTWADLIIFPKEIVSGTNEEALPKLREFVADLKESRLSRWINFIPTYVRLDIDDSSRVVSTEVTHYKAEGAA